MTNTRVLEGILASVANLAPALGGQWGPFLRQLLDIADALPEASEAELQAQIDKLLTLGFATAGAATILRLILRRAQLGPPELPARDRDSSTLPTPRPNLEGGGGIRRPPVGAESAGAGGHRRLVANRLRTALLRRFVNVCLTHVGGEAVPRRTDLAARGQYHLRLDIGPLSPESVVEQPGWSPFPADLLPPSDDGHWLEVLAVSSDFEISLARGWLFLPQTGAGWVCDCRPGGAHRCRSESRKPHLTLRVIAPERPGSAELRIAVYCGKNLVQSQLLVAQVGEIERAGTGYFSRVDYTLSAGLADLERFPAQAMNILTNDSGDGTHRIVINGDKDEPLFLTPTDGLLTTAIDGAREALRRIHFEDRVGWLGGAERSNLLDENNAKSHLDLLADLTALAPLGWLLWTSLFGSRPVWRERFRRARQNGPVRIQVSRVGGSEFVFPWALVYDIPLERGAALAPCRVLESAENLWRVAADPATARCPFEREHPTKNLLCPFGFWGYQHLVEQPPSFPEDATVGTDIRSDGAKPQMLFGYHQGMNAGLAAEHRKVLGQDLDFTILPCDTGTAIRDAIARPDLAVVYFYCHGKRETIPGAKGSVPYLEVGIEDRIFPSDVVTWSVADWPNPHWELSRPLVFVNGCHTAELTPDALVNFVDTFAGVYAAGVIGTEISVHQRLANEAASTFFGYLLAAVAVGEAIRRMRFHLLAKGNLLGLAYTPYCSTELTLLRPAE
jgi:hypothetical protein